MADSRFFAFVKNVYKGTRNVSSVVTVKDGVMSAEWKGTVVSAKAVEGAPEGIFDADKASVGVWSKVEQPFEPDIPQADGSFVLLSPKQVKDIRGAFACASDDMTRYFMNGICFDREGPVVSTDGRRMSVMAGLEDIPRPEGDFDVIVPTHPAIDRMLSGAAKHPVLLCLGKKHAFLAAYDTVLAVPYIEGQFPRWRKVVPEGGKTVVLPPVALWKEIAKKLSVIVPGESNRIRIGTDGAVEYAADGKLPETLNLGLPLQLYVKWKYLDFALSVFGASSLAFQPPDSEDDTMCRALVFKREGDGSFHIVMPMLEGWG